MFGRGQGRNVVAKVLSAGKGDFAFVSFTGECRTVGDVGGSVDNSVGKHGSPLGYRFTLEPLQDLPWHRAGGGHRTTGQFTINTIDTIGIRFTGFRWFGKGVEGSRFERIIGSVNNAVADSPDFAVNDVIGIIAESCLVSRLAFRAFHGTILYRNVKHDLSFQRGNRVLLLIPFRVKHSRPSSQWFTQHIKLVAPLVAFRF